MGKRIKQYKINYIYPGQESDIKYLCMGEAMLK